MSDEKKSNEETQEGTVDTDELMVPLENPETDPVERARYFIEQVLGLAGFDIDDVTGEGDGNIEIDIDGPEARNLVRQPNGVDSPVVLDALAQLGRLVAFPGSTSSRPVVVDADDYRSRRHEQLGDLADYVGEKVEAEGNDINIYGMNSVDRRAVHRHLGERSDVKTQSKGYGVFRRLTVRES